MAKRKLIWRLYPSYLLITVVALIAITWYVITRIETFYYESASDHLKNQALTVLNTPFDRSILLDKNKADALCKILGRKTDVRLTIILPGGKVIGDSAEEPITMDDHSDRPEFIEAVKGSVGTSQRFSYTVQENFMYVAVPFLEGDKVKAVIRTSRSMKEIDDALNDIYSKIIIGGIVIALFSAAVSLMVANLIGKPLKEMKRVASKFANGDFKHRIVPPDTAEFADVAEALNLMASQLYEKINQISDQKQEQEAILASMVEGLLAVDSEERLLDVNPAAQRLLDIDLEKAKGRLIHEVVRNTELQEFIQKTLESHETLEGEILLSENGDIYLQLNGTPLRDYEDREIGALIVLNDITRLRRLEEIRQDFVANVSHELKTPITSIKTSYETLANGDIQEKADAEKFLDIIGKNTDRLNAIIEDLLNLSRIEQRTEKQEVELVTDSIQKVVKSAVQQCQNSADEKSINLKVKCDKALRAEINEHLLELAIVNLLDNAIKYSEEGDKVEIECLKKDGNIEIKVRDEGIGIDSRHLDRIFERFYRVDKARSRELGGTGLGLAIVKHIAESHKGKVEVESKIRKGSVFTLIIPAIT